MRILIGLIAGFVGSFIGSEIAENNPFFIDKILHHCSTQGVTEEYVECVFELSEDEVVVYEGTRIGGTVLERGRMPSDSEDPPFGASFLPGPGIYRIEIQDGYWEVLPADELPHNIL